jgi:DNA-binding transcriptional LysR family regulator
MIAPIDCWGPFRPDIDAAERLARLRALRAITHLCAGPRGDRLATELHRAERDVSRLPIALEALAALTARPPAGARVVRPCFLARHPQIRIDLRLTDRFVDVVAEGIDVSIRVSSSEQRDSSLTIRKIASYRNLLVASPGYLSAHGTPRKPAELMQHACLGFTGYAAWPDWPLTKDGKRHTVRPNCALVADHSEVLLMAAIEGAGITFTADWLAGPALRAGRLIEVLPGWGGKRSGGVYAVLPPGRLVPTKTRLFVDEVAEAIKAGWAR